MPGPQRPVRGVAWRGAAPQQGSQMIELFSPILDSHFRTFFVQIAQMGSHFAQNTATAPVLFSAVTNPFRGYVCTQNTPNPTPKHPSSWPDFESGQNQLLSGQMDPNWANFLKSGQNISRSGQKNLFIGSPRCGGRDGRAGSDARGGGGGGIGGAADLWPPAGPLCAGRAVHVGRADGAAGGAERPGSTSRALWRACPSVPRADAFV